LKPGILRILGIRCCGQRFADTRPPGAPITQGLVVAKVEREERVIQRRSAAAKVLAQVE
jgi:hypothetical protein